MYSSLKSALILVFQYKHRHNQSFPSTVLVYGHSINKQFFRLS